MISSFTDYGDIVSRLACANFIISSFTDYGVIESRLACANFLISSFTDYSVIVSRLACANFGQEGDCCTWRAMIQVVKCPPTNRDRQDYFVYQLQSPPGCNIAYCAGRVGGGGVKYNSNKSISCSMYPYTVQYGFSMGLVMNYVGQVFTIPSLYSFSAGLDIRRQNLTSIDVRF